MDAPVCGPDLMQIRQAQLLTALIACTEGICEINVTRNTVLSAHTPDERQEPGALPAYTDAVRKASGVLAPEEREKLLAFLAPEHLAACYAQGERRVAHTLYTTGESEIPESIRLEALLYENAQNGELLGLVYAQNRRSGMSPGEPAALCPENGQERQDGIAGERRITLEACYRKLGGDFEEVKTRLPSPKLIEKFIGKFLDDRSFETLCREIEAGHRREAFRAAHTLTGVCANLSFTCLMESVSRLTEALRPETDAVSETAAVMLEDVRRNYRHTADTIREYLGEP